ncbi:MAG: hypothetical protein HC922_04060 [Leptolyngbyaceae cyanobacterium SM2_3_12]|nr:hypothetical protein [Leptolyngbyaceae cyanobacterium SM2_3_12]
MLVPLPQHELPVECPRCRRHTLVRHGESEYVCLNCGFRRNLDHYYPGPGDGFLLFMFFGITLALLLSNS